MTFRVLVISTSTLYLCCNLIAVVLASPVTRPGTGDIEPTRPVPPLPEKLPRSEPSPLLKPNQAPPSPTKLPAIEARIKVKQVEVLGSTVFSPKQLQKVTFPFVGKNLTLNQLLEIRTAVNELYISKGYITSGAFLPPQEVSDGVVRVQVIEGKLERIDISGLRRLKKSYVRSRIEAATNPPLDISRLEEALQMLQLNPLFSKVSAELTAGTATGRNVLILNLKEANPINTSFGIGNQENPSVGSFGGTSSISHNNLLGFGDRLDVTFGLTEGVTSWGFDYKVPVSDRGELSFGYSNGRNKVIEEPFAPLDIKGRSQSYAIGFRQYIIRSPKTEFALSLSGDIRRSATYLFNDEPFSFTEGPENGKSRVSALRFSQEWVDRTSSRVLAARSQFSFGIDAFDATINDTGTDGRFFSWLGQFQWLQALNKKRDTTLVVRAASQLTGDSLLPLEQLSIGGIDTVRGYRMNQRVGDSGVFGSVEVRLPIIRDPGGFGLLQITPFVDAGTIWSNGNGDNGTLASTGLGLRWQLGNSLSARLDWGIPLVDVDKRGNSLQDNGVDFAIQWQPF